MVHAPALLPMPPHLARRPQRSSWALLPGGGRSRYNPIGGAELAGFIAGCLLDTPSPYADKEVQ